MRYRYFIQFRFPKDLVCEQLPEPVSGRVSRLIRDGKRYSTLEIADDQELFDGIVRSDRLVNGRSLIRLTRREFLVDPTSISESDHYELRLLWDNPVRLSGQPSHYYRLEDVCGRCGYARWVQTHDLRVPSAPRGDLLETQNGEILVSRVLGSALSGRCGSDVSLRETDSIDLLQLMVHRRVSVVRDEFYHEKNPCTRCGRARTVYLEDSNGVALVGNDGTEARHERQPLLSITGTMGTVSLTDLEFGTVGRIPEGAGVVDTTDAPFRTSWPRVVLSGEVAMLLLKYDVHGLRLSPVGVIGSGTEV